MAKNLFDSIDWSSEHIVYSTNYTFSDIDESESDYSQIEEVTAGISSLSQTLQKKITHLELISFSS